MLLISHLIWSAAFKLLDHSWKPRSHHQRRPSQVAVWSPCKFEVHGEITGCTRHVVKEKTSREWSKNISYAGSCLDITEKMMLNERSEMFKSGRVFNYYGPDLRAFWSHTYSILKWLLCMSQKKVNVHFTLSFHSALQSKLNQILPCIDAFPITVVWKLVDPARSFKGWQNVSCFGIRAETSSDQKHQGWVQDVRAMEGDPV